MAALAFLVTFFSASQDIVVDAYRTDVTEKNEIGPSASLYIVGYRVAYLLANGFALVLADHVSWQSVYLIMAGLVSICTLVTIFAPEPHVQVKPPRNLKDAVILPLVEFFNRKGAFEIILFLLLYKIDTVITQALMTPFLMDLSFSKTQIGALSKTVGLGATLIGTLIAGRAIPSLGVKKSLLTFGLLQGLAGLSFAMLAHLGHSYPMMVTAVTVEFLTSAMGNVAYAGFILMLCNKNFSATQYALFTSLMALTRVFGQSPTGFLAKSVGWEFYYLIAVVIMIPGLFVLLRFDRWNFPGQEKLETI
jgi:PAT family beta-lactamase induction signal transducer AmpG